MAAMGIRSRVSLDRKAACARELAILIDAGLPLLRTLRVLTQRTSDPNLARALEDVANRVERGGNLAASMAAHPSVFDELFVNMVKTGETGGSLDVALKRLATHYERERELSVRVRNAMTYPVSALLIASAVIAIIVVWVVPRFIDFYETANVQLPWPTLAVQWLGTIIIYGWWLIILGAIGLYFLYGWYRTTPTGRRQIDRFKLSVPRLSGIYMKVLVTRMSATLATLIQNGIPLVPALRLTGDTVGNVHVAEVCGKAAGQVESGESLTTTFQEARMFPDLFLDMVGVGEEAGALDATLERVTEVYGEDTRAALDNLVTMIQPAMVVLIGIAVIFLALAVLLPYFEVQNVVMSL